MGKGQRPYGGAQMHLMEMGWEMQWCQGLLRLKNQKGDIWQPNPQYGMGLSRQMLEEARENLVMGKGS
eukprot:1874116-Karenia_brevis.AAC.1